MDVLNDRIVEIALNALGYLVAGGLGMLLYSTRRPRRSRSVAVAEAVRESEAAASAASASEPSESFEFVDLRTGPPKKASNPDSPTITAAGAPSARRDRREIIRLAREMLNAGTSGAQVRRRLPIAENELALLQNVNSK